MKNRFLLLLIVGAAGLTSLSPGAHAQGRGGGLGGTGGPEPGPGSIAIKNINLSTPISPDYAVTGPEAKRFVPGKWLEVEVEFSCAVPARELTFHYYILLGGTLLAGEVTHVDIPVSQSSFSVMYVAPRTISTILKGQPLNASNVQNVAVQIVRPSVTAPLAEKMLRAAGPFYTTMPQVTGFVLNKTQTPFAPLWWDRYEAVKSANAPQ